MSLYAFHFADLTKSSLEWVDWLPDFLPQKLSLLHCKSLSKVQTAWKLCLPLNSKFITQIAVLNKLKSSNVARLYSLAQDRPFYFFPAPDKKDTHMNTEFNMLCSCHQFSHHIYFCLPFYFAILLNITKLILSGLNLLTQSQTTNSRNLPFHTN